MLHEPFVHVIDDDEALRDSLEFLFQAADLPVRLYESASAFLRDAPEGVAGCIVTDVRMPDMSGLDLLREVKRRGLELPVIVITGHGDIPLAVEAMQAGAQDFLEKPFDDERLLGLVRKALEREAETQPQREEQAAARARLARLSQRERQVLERLVQGQLNKTIAWELGISARTVEVYRAKLMAKMEAAAFADLVRMALLAREPEAGGKGA
jgi:two-component system response regulator FixJ